MVPTQVNSASLHPDCTIFVCGGEDFKMYKFDYATGAEIGNIFYFYNLAILIESNIDYKMCMFFRIFQGTFWTCTLCSFFTRW